MIKIAILSDLHVNTNDERVQNKIFENIINHFEELISEGDWIDIVLVTGDITSSGKDEEFFLALNFFKRLQLALGVPHDNFIFVNGNHDYDRSKLDVSFKYIDNPNLETYQEIFESVSFDQHIKRVFKNYNNFLREFHGNIPSITGYRKIIPLHEITVSITVLNSSLVNTIGREKLPLYINKDYVNSLFSDELEATLSLFIMHHPISNLFIENRHQLDSLLINKCDILISGHEHIPDYSLKKDIEGNEYFNIISGSTFLPSAYNVQNQFHRFSIIEIEEEIYRMTIIPSFTLPHLDHCGRDTSLYPSAKTDGIITCFIKDRPMINVLTEDEDPLDKFEVPEYLNNFFDKNFNQINNANTNKQLFDLRKSIKGGESLNLNRIAFCFLKFIISNDLIQKFDELKNSLTSVHLLSHIKNHHRKIIKYYNQQYFNKRYKDIKKTISVRHKERNIVKLKKKLTQAEEKIETLERQKRSILEMYHQRPPELIPKLMYDENIEISEHFVWYKKFGLISDPFPSNDGLENIQEEFFEKVIYPTETIEEFKNIIISEDLADLINKTISIYGPFGSGKTTLFQYIERLIAINTDEISTIFISLEARATLDEIRRRFFLKLFLSLKDLHMKELGYSIIESDLEEDCLNMLRNLSNNKKYLFIFIEDIYKHSGREDYQSEVIGFIKALQIYRKDFSGTGVKTTFFFSALTEIVEKIRRDHSISGGVDNYHKMSVINFDTSLAMINKRLKAFSKNPQNPPKVSREYLSRLKNIAKQNGTPINTFRDYIEILVERFRRLEFTEDSITIESDDQAILSVQKDLEEMHPEIHVSFKNLIEISKNERNIFERFISILDTLWSGDPIIEGDRRFYRDKAYFIHLYNSNFLKKLFIGNKIGWTLNDDCKNYFDKINNQYGLFPSSIIPSVYFAKERLSIVENKYIMIIQNVINRSEGYGTEFLSLLKTGTEYYKELYLFSTSVNILKEDCIDEFLIQKIEISFQNFLMAIVLLCDEKKTKYPDVLILYEESWYEIQHITRFAKFLKDFKELALVKKEDKISLLKEFLSVIKTIIPNLSKLVQWDSVFSLKSSKIWNSEKRYLNSIRKNIDNNNLYLANQKIFDLLRQKLKDLVYKYSVILFGYKKWRIGLSEKYNKKLDRMKKSTSPAKSVAHNEYLLKFKVEELFEIISYIISITRNQIEFLEPIPNLYSSIKNNFKKQNIWSGEILNLIELIDSFYERLLNGEVKTPWNSKDINELPEIDDKVKVEDSFDEIFFANTPLIFDNSLRPTKYFDKRFNLRHLVYWVHKNKGKIKIDISYRKELIIIDIKKE